MKQQNKDWKIYGGAALAMIITQGLWLSSWFMLKTPVTKKNRPTKQATLHVFIHGTFGSPLGFLSFFPVINDDFKGSHYVKTTRLMRKDPYFYKDQPILERGLIKIDPHYDLTTTETYKKIAYPLIQGYSDVHSLIKANNSLSLFYTFGWSGLLSRQRRRQEALRLYNALSEEVATLQKQGYSTKIIIAAHSHGGNIALNLAGINNARTLLASDLTSTTSLHEEQAKMYSFLSSCTTKTNQSMTGQKKFDYLPELSSLHIDRLYLLGTPIQPETDHYATDTHTFKRVYNFYSENDPIQKMDWVSTSRYYSEQKFNRISSSCPSIIQAKITYDRVKEDEDISFFAKMLPSLTTPASRFDPSHRDFWFIALDNDPNNRSFLYPLPLFIFCPVLHTLCKRQSNNDITINISRMHNNLRFAALTQDTEMHLHSEIIPLSFVHTIQTQLLPWQPDQACRKQEFDIIAGHVKKASP